MEIRIPRYLPFKRPGESLFRKREWAFKKRGTRGFDRTPGEAGCEGKQETIRQSFYL